MKSISLTVVILLLAVFHPPVMGMSGNELNENNIAPAPVLGGRGQEVSLTGDSWQAVAETGGTPVIVSASKQEGWSRLTLKAGKTAGIIETKIGFEAKPWHIYQVEIPLRGPCSTTAAVQLRLQGEKVSELSVWPDWFCGNAGLNPSGFVVRGYAAVSPGTWTMAKIRVSFNGKAPVQSEADTLAETGIPKVKDLGTATLIQPEIWYQSSFEKWTPDGKPDQCAWFYFAKPGQVVPTTEDVHSGQTAATNKDGRIYLGCYNVPCRFGTFLRIRVWARGKGTIVLSATPYSGGLFRELPPMETGFPVDGGWKCYEIVIGQNRVEADSLIPTMDIYGLVTIDDWTVEKISYWKY